MPKAEPFRIRLNRITDRFVADEARRTRRSKSAIVEALTEEAARMRLFPGIGFRGQEPYRDAWVIGSGLDVWEIVHMLEDFGSAERLVAETHLTEPQGHLALRYREEHPDEIDEAVAENRRPLEEWRELYPFVRVE